MSRYLCIIPRVAMFWVEADSLFLAEACAAVTLELDTLPHGALLLRNGGVA